LKERERDDRDDEIARLKSKVGEITMDNELLYAKIAAMEGKRPLAPQEAVGSSLPATQQYFVGASLLAFNIWTFSPTAGAAASTSLVVSSNVIGLFGFPRNPIASVPGTNSCNSASPLAQVVARLLELCLQAGDRRVDAVDLGLVLEAGAFEFGQGPIPCRFRGVDAARHFTTSSARTACSWASLWNNRFW
jgi:hypothetical protein